jgi:4'-phosphopantetheinyl transferase
MSAPGEASRAACAWAPGPEHPLLGDGEVHLWRADLAALQDELCELLCSQERERAERILNSRARALWMRSRGVLRALLGRYLQQEARALRFAAGPHGKPALLQSTHGQAQAPGLRSPLSFNLSHSGELALYALTTSGPLGVDVELARRPIDAVAIARRTFGEAEADRLAGLEPQAREQEFRRLWVRHEAELKRLGTGIGAARDPAQEPAGWICELDVGAGAAAAVAVGEQPRELRCWQWR